MSDRRTPTRRAETPSRAAGTLRKEEGGSLSDRSFAEIEARIDPDIRAYIDGRLEMLTDQLFREVRTERLVVFDPSDGFERLSTRHSLDAFEVTLSSKKLDRHRDPAASICLYVGEEAGCEEDDASASVRVSYQNGGETTIESDATTSELRMRPPHVRGGVLVTSGNGKRGGTTGGFHILDDRATIDMTLDGEGLQFGLAR